MIHDTIILCDLVKANHWETSMHKHGTIFCIYWQVKIKQDSKLHLLLERCKIKIYTNF